MSTFQEIDGARLYLERIPFPKMGERNATLNRIAFRLANLFHLVENEFFRLLQSWAGQFNPALPAMEAERTICSAWKAAKGGCAPRPSFARSTQMEIDPIAAATQYLGPFSVSESDVFEASPIRPPDDWRDDPLALLETLYRPGEHINVVSNWTGKEDGTVSPSGYGITLERDQWINRILKGGMPQSEAGGWWRMNPLDGHGIADKNVTAFRFALLEFDAISMSLQLSLFAKFPLPIAAILTSGGKSIHAWIKVDAANPAEFDTKVTRIFELLSKLFKLDAANRNASRLSRAVGAQRTLGAKGDGRQRLLYLNPNPTAKRILS